MCHIRSVAGQEDAKDFNQSPQKKLCESNSEDEEGSIYKTPNMNNLSVPILSEKSSKKSEGGCAKTDVNYQEILSNQINKPNTFLKNLDKFITMNSFSQLNYVELYNLVSRTSSR